MNSVSSSFNIPEVNGTFNGWCGNCWQMEDPDGDGIWEKQVTMLEGYYEFKFSADNWAITEPLDPGWACTNGNAQYTNRTLEVDENVVICPQWNACVPTCSSIIISEINENTKQSNLLYPNPSFGVFNLNSNNFSDLKVVDVLGKIVYEKNSLENTQTINLKHLPFGFYQCVYYLQKKISIPKNTNFKISFMKQLYTPVLLFVFLFAACSGKQTNLSFELNPEHERKIDALISQMSLEEKVGQTCQITLDAILQKDSDNKLIEPHQIDLEKLEEAINKYKVGSVLNVSNHTFTLEKWNGIVKTIQEAAAKSSTKIPVIYGVDAIHGATYIQKSTLFLKKLDWQPVGILLWQERWEELLHTKQEHLEFHGISHQYLI